MYQREMAFREIPRVIVEVIWREPKTLRWFSFS
ncbi:unnamed protein product [Spirodela intermedia]|uniref:Uncharacterized protein n=2 Tax=Spirodela intermedia TaxID=51605 RepID=A0A7I8LJR1_SPIIN|nr:unnamed protein product [Spirodela intermedia]CAA6673086.1 unnamed protein product [Spirodela intermedia]CAA7410301.1 unnamed protein product [Spirodela intermedia]